MKLPDEQAFDAGWEMERGYLRRLLAAWTRDLDMADDLLQETYLRACAGLSGFRGTEFRPWLAAIARNVFYTSRRGVHVQDTLTDVETLPADAFCAGSAEHVAILTIRQALSELPPLQRTALILRHYAGLSYAEIADRLQCPVGTARRRVWSAIRRLQAAFGETRKERTMGCHEITGRQLLAHLHHALSTEAAAQLEQHLAACPTCRSEIENLRTVLDSLQAVRGDFVIYYLTELTADGEPTLYVWSRFVNSRELVLIGKEPGGTLREFGFINEAGTTTEYLALQGEEVSLTVRPWEHDPTRLHYTAILPRPVPPGQAFDGMAISHPAPGTKNARQDADGRLRYTVTLGLGAQRDAAIIIHTLRLPAGAEFLEADPPATEVITRGECTTLTWRLAPPPDQATDYSVWYRQ